MISLCSEHGFYSGTSCTLCQLYGKGPMLVQAGTLYSVHDVYGDRKELFVPDPELTMKAPTQQQLNDPKWWDENAPEWAQSLIEARTSADGLAWFEYGVGFGKAQWLNNGDSLTADTRPPTGWTVIAHRPAKPEPEPKERDAEPDAYMCPAGCGCLWRDNGDETMSLYGPNSRSCNICEPMRLDELVPVQKLRTQADREREEVIAEAMELTCGKDDGRDRIQRSVIRQCFEDLYEVGMLRKDNA